MKYIGYLIVAIALCGVIYGGFLVKRWFNYEFGYASQVQGSICEMVKPEYLKNPSECDE